MARDKNSSFGMDALCEECKGRAFKRDIGICKRCGRGTSSGALKLCNACGLKTKTCQCCGKPLKTAE